MKFGFVLLTYIFFSGTVLRAEEDIIEHVAAHPRREEQVQQPDGSYKVSKYGDHRLAEAESFLASRYPRPWTPSKAIAWFHETVDVPTRVHLLRLLAASRDPGAAIVLGDNLYSGSLDIRVAACDGLLDYYLPTGVSGGTEQQFHAANKWFADNKTKLQKEALK